VVGGRVVRDAEFEAVSVALEGGEAPAVEAVAPCVDFFEGYSGTELIEVETVVDVVPETRVAEDVALAGSFLACEAIGGLAVLAWVAVAVGVKIDDSVVGRCALELKTGLVVVVRGEELVVVVRCIASVDTVWAVDQSGTNVSMWYGSSDTLDLL
jgi:hypothetical protein